MKKNIVLILVFVLFLASCTQQQTTNKTKTHSANSSTNIKSSTNNSKPTKKSKTEITTQGTTQPKTEASTTVSKNDTEETSKKISNFSPVSQYPELPNGCEVTSLSMVLNYYNVQCDKCEISDTYLSKGPVGTVDFNKAFEGDPRDEDAYGCYANVIMETAKRIIYTKKANLSVEDFTGTNLKSLFKYVKKDIPVIVWGTQDCQKGHYSVTWNVDGKDLTWFTPEHCMVLVGFDESLVWVADPMHGDIRSYDLNTFEECYNDLNKQAVVIKET